MMFDDGLTDFDFDVVDNIIQQHHEKQQGSQAPASPYSKGPQGSLADSAPKGNAPSTSYGQQHLQQQPQIQQHQWTQQQHNRNHHQPQHQQQPQQQQQHGHHAYGQRQPTQSANTHQGAHSQHQYGAVQHRATQQAHHAQNVPNQQPARQKTQQSSFPGHSRHHASSAPQGHVSSQAASALGQQPQQQHQQPSHQQALQHQPQQRASQQAGPFGNSSIAAGQQGLEAQLRRDLDQLQQQVNQLQGTNSLLRSNLDRVTRERDEKQRSLQQQQQSGLSAFTAAEAQKQVNVMQQQLAFKAQEEEGLQRRCAEKDEQMQQLEQQIGKLEGQLHEVQLQLSLAHSDRQDRGMGTSSSLNPPLPLPRHLSPSPSKQRKPGSSSVSGSKLTGTKRKLSSLLGDATGGVGVGSPLANGHAPLPLQASQQNGQHTALPARRSTGVQAVASPEAPAPSVTAPAPQAPDIPAHELPFWSPSSASLHSSSTPLQQLWLQCPDTLALLLHDQGAAAPAWSSQPTQGFRPSMTAGPALHRRTDSAVDHSAFNGAGLASLTHGGSVPSQVGTAPGRERGMESMKAQMHQRVQMLACNAPNAGALMLQTLVELLQQCCPPQAQKQDDAAAPAQAEPRRSPHGADTAAGMTWQAAGTRVAASCFDVLRVLIAHDSSCQQGIHASCTTQSSSQVPDQTPAAVPNAHEIASLVRGMQLSSRLTVSIGDRVQPATASASAALDSQFARQSANTAQASRQGQDLVHLILQLLPDLLASCPATALSALRCLSAIVAVTPIADRAALEPVVTSGVLEMMMTKPLYSQQALHLLHMLIQSDAVCALLDKGLAGGSGPSPGPDGGSPTADEAADNVRPSSRPGAALQQQGQSAQNAVDLDSDDPPVRWKGTAALLSSLMACLEVNPEPMPLTPPDPTSPNPPHPPSTSTAASQTAALHTPTDSLQSSRGVHRTQRLALLVLATLLQQHQHGLLLYMVKQGEGTAEGVGLCQNLLEMVDAVTRGATGDLLAALTLPHNPATPPVVRPWHQKAAPQMPTSSSNKPNSQEAEHLGAAATNTHTSIDSGARLWQEHVRLAQEGLTLLRMILNNNPLGRVGIESLVSSSSAIRLSLITSMRLSHWAEEEASIKSNHDSMPLPVQPWVTAWGSSSSHVKFVNGLSEWRGDLVCCSMQDVAHMAKSLRTRVLLKLNRMSA